MTTSQTSSRKTKLRVLIVGARPARICGALIAAGLVTAAATAGTAMYSNQQQKKAAAANQKAMGAVPDIKLPDYPDFIPHEFWPLQRDAIANDRLYYQRSDADFKKRHGDLVAAEKLFKQQTLKDQQGESELMPALQAELMRGGMADSLAAFGGDVGTLAPGSAGEANVAVHMGQGIMDFQQRNRDNRQRALALAEELFPRREFGLSGRDATAITMQNTAGRNNHAQGEYGHKVQAEMTRHGQATDRANFTIGSNNAQAQADAQMAASIAQGIGSVASAGAGAYGQSVSSAAGGYKGTAQQHGMPGLGGAPAASTPVYAGIRA
jgi:hypothetical protein